MESKKILMWMYKIFKHGISYFIRKKLFSSVPLYCVMHGILLIYVKEICHPLVNSAPTAFTFSISFVLAVSTKVQLEL